MRRKNFIHLIGLISGLIVLTNYHVSHAIIAPLTGFFKIPRPYIGAGYSWETDVTKYGETNKNSFGRDLTRFNNTNLHVGITWGSLGVQLTYGTLSKFIRSAEFCGFDSGNGQGGNFKTEYTALNGIIRLLGLHLGVASVELLANVGMAQMGNAKISFQSYNGENHNFSKNALSFTYGIGVQANLLNFLSVKVGVDVFEMRNNYINSDRLIAYNTSIFIYPLW